MKRFITLLFCLVLIHISLTGCAEKQNLPLNISEQSRNILHLPVYAAMKLNYFADRGIEVKLTEAQGEKEVMQAVLLGKADIALSTPAKPVLAFQAFTPKSVQIFALLSETDGAYLKKEADNGIPSGGEVPAAVCFASKDILERDYFLFQKFTDSIKEAEQWIDSHSAEDTAALLIGYFPGKTASELTKEIGQYKDRGVFAKTPLLTKKSFDLLQQKMEQNGLIQKRALYEMIVRTDFAEQAAK